MFEGALGGATLDQIHRRLVLGVQKRSLVTRNAPWWRDTANQRPRCWCEGQEKPESSYW